ncbi:hypothetical protein FB45DRAFT_933082 [Roridomyces roridus]|uniref:Uncharacterized protein n=1 Tax=Roridomyces roridus TaxID=1738132 RepID=A0AAD7BE06_9AGAR|nr:hypothetical protein FB45DRAFT_933082 [Roridomyces roridus]
MSVTPTASRERIVLFYPYFLSGARALTPVELHPGPPTFANNPEILSLSGLFQAEVDPGLCDRCSNRYYHHPTLPDVVFTLFMACTHTAPDSPALHPNKAVASLLHPKIKHKTCRGSVIVVKHAHTHVPGSCVSSRKLPIVDVLESDIPHLNVLVAHNAAAP